MKRFYFILALMIFLYPQTSSAQARGPLGNIWASWASVANGITTTWTLPFNSRDVQVINSSSTPACIDMRGNAFGSDAGLCRNNTATRFYLDGGDSIQLYDFITNSISAWGLGGAASPVTVIITY